jgi:hypothetical protein
VFTSALQHQAEIVADILENEGIKAVVINRRDSVYNNFGDFVVKVPPDDVIRALKIIEDDIVFG